jgi:hypothetical protein
VATEPIPAVTPMNAEAPTNAPTMAILLISPIGRMCYLLNALPPDMPFAQEHS